MEAGGGGSGGKEGGLRRGQEELKGKMRRGTEERVGGWDTVVGGREREGIEGKRRCKFEKNGGKSLVL